MYFLKATDMIIHFVDHSLFSHYGFNGLCSTWNRFTCQFSTKPVQSCSAAIICTSFLGPCLRGWRVSTVSPGSVPPWDAGLWPVEAVRVLLLWWSDRRLLGQFLGGLWWCSGAAFRSFLPPFFSKTCFVLFVTSLLEISDIGLLFSTLPMLASSPYAVDPSNMSLKWRKHKQAV